MDFDFVSLIIVISLIIIIYKYFEKYSYDVIMVKSNINGKSYLVRNLEDKQDAADLLAKISLKLEKLIDIIKTAGYEKIYDKYVKNDITKESQSIEEINKNKRDLIQGQDGGNSATQELERQIKNKLQDDISRLISNFNPDAFSETTPDAKYTSYSVNKGEKIVFCLRDKKEGEMLVKENIMTFVAIHELAHLMTKSVGHEPEFWNSFKLLLKIAIDNGIYKNIDFNSTPKDYCGVKITDTPLKLKASIETLQTPE
jgi:predicted metal-dependent hydrolase